MNTNPENESRIVYLDYLRVFSAFAIMILHLCGGNWSYSNIHTSEWLVFNFYDSIVRWGVPVFIMISGALFLHRDVPVSKLYSKYILRMAIAFLFWSVLYAVFANVGWLGKIKEVLTGHYHMWFIPVIVGIYMCIPFLKPIADDPKKTKYFLLLTVIFTFIIPEIVTLMEDFGSPIIVKGSSLLNSMSSMLNLRMIAGLTGYFVLGHFLNCITLSKTQRIVIYALGIVGFASTVFLTRAVTMKAGTPLQHYFDNSYLNIALEAIAVFTLFKYGKYKFKKLNAFVAMLAKYSFGAYLIHAFIIEMVITKTGISSYYSIPIPGIPLMSIILFFISFIISALINQIPLVKKYIV